MHGEWSAMLGLTSISPSVQWWWTDSVRSRWLWSSNYDSSSPRDIRLFVFLSHHPTAGGGDGHESETKLIQLGIDQVKWIMCTPFTRPPWTVGSVLEPGLWIELYNEGWMDGAKQRIRLHSPSQLRHSESGETAVAYQMRSEQRINSIHTSTRTHSSSDNELWWASRFITLVGWCALV